MKKIFNYKLYFTIILICSTFSINAQNNNTGFIHLYIGDIAQNLKLEVYEEFVTTGSHVTYTITNSHAKTIPIFNKPYGALKLIDNTGKSAIYNFDLNFEGAYCGGSYPEMVICVGHNGTNPSLSYYGSGNYIPPYATGGDPSRDTNQKEEVENPLKP